MPRNHPNRRVATAPHPTPAQVRAAREEAELTQAAAAALVGVSLRAYQQWESETEGDTRKMHPGLFRLFILLTKFPETIAALEEKLRLEGGRKR